MVNSGRYPRTGLSSSTSPRSTSCMTASEVNDLLTDATAMGVSAVTGSPEEVSPYPATWTTRVPLVIASATPGSPVASR
jgi:hypothetical protein